MNPLTNNIMMIRPAKFGYNSETAKNNAFQTKDEKGESLETHMAAQQEFDELVAKLRSVGVNVLVIEDTATPVKPDAVFPNNWISLHGNGSVVTYPMFAENRRIERRQDIIDQLSEKYDIEKKYSFESYEEESLFLEGTGSMIFDRVNKVLYACLSARTDIEVLNKFGVLMDYRVVFFHSVDSEGNDIYHTNVMMALGEDFVVICLDTIKDELEKQKVLKSFKETNKRIIEISYKQMEQFAGNMLEVYGKDAKRYTVMSKAAYKSLTPEQINNINKTSNILYSDIKTIEQYGGGSVRCMMAENFLRPLES